MVGESGHAPAGRRVVSARCAMPSMIRFREPASGSAILLLGDPSPIGQRTAYGSHGMGYQSLSRAWYSAPLTEARGSAARGRRSMSLVPPANLAFDASEELARLRRQLERQSLVLEITRLVTSETDLDRLLLLIADKTVVALNADRATVYLLDHQRQELAMRVASELEIREIRLPIGVGLAGYVAKTGETLNIADCYEDPRFDPSWDKRTGYRTRSMLVMPMRNTQGETIGVFQVINKRREDGTLPDSRAGE